MDLVTLALAKKFAGSGGSGQGGTLDYSNLNNKPQIGGVELVGNKSLADYGIQPALDNSLFTDDKTIVGAINELLEKINALTPNENETLLTISK